MGSAETLPATTPVAAGQRLAALDLIRGAAVLGILLANITAMANPDLAYWWPGALPGGGNAADGWVWLAQFVLVDGKLRALFTVLFGASLALFAERHGNGPHGTSLQVRRLVLLGLFGLLHFFLLFEGDILFTYACGGLLALFALRTPPEKLLALGMVWLVGAGILQVLPWITPALAEAGSTGAGAKAGELLVMMQDGWNKQMAEAAEQARVMGGGSYAEVVRFRLNSESVDLWSYASWALFETVPLILIGVACYRLGLFAPPGPDQGPDDYRERRRLILLGWLLVASGMALNLATGWWAMRGGFAPYATQLVVFGTATLTNLPLIAGMVLLVGRWAVRLAQAEPRGWLTDRLVLAGRMAFTNYLGTSLVMMLVFQGWAGGLYGTMHRLDLLLVVVLGWAMMLAFSRLWLARFRHGPLEWVWRCLTYGRWFPNRLPI